MKYSLLTIFTFCLSLTTFASTQPDGFLTPSEAHGLPLIAPSETVFKIEIGPGMHGTAFAISSDLLVTNTHNVTQCLRDHNLVDAGYSNEAGPLVCKSLSVLLDNRKANLEVFLVGSNSRYNSESLDFAVIKVPGLKARPVNLSETKLEDSSDLFIVGFPGETYRAKQAVRSKLEKLILLFDSIFEVEHALQEVDVNKISSQEILQIWLNQGFQKIQPNVMWSNYLSGSLLGNDWNPLIQWQAEAPAVYLQNLIRHLDSFKKDVFVFFKIAEKSYSDSIDGYSDADGQLRVSMAKYFRSVSSDIHILSGDATPGSSGSLVLNSTGHAVGILFQIRGLEVDNKSFCILDAIMTDFESINFQHCSDLGPTFVSSGVIIEKLKQWRVSY
jgi:hypothetical protein